MLRDGIVVEQGNHDMLLKAGGLYHDMWLEQASESWSTEPEPEPELSRVEKAEKIV